MKSRDSERIEELFHAAAELPTRDRADFLKRADQRLAQTVLDMLQAARDPVWGQSALEIEARQTAFDSRPAQPGQVFGPYRILHRIATGGMSFVYEAVRDDAEFHKRVAIKFVQQGIDNAAGIERFRVERQILAQLEHPNIARLLDGGTTSEGVPYLVMEYVEGMPIDGFAAARRLSRAGRLMLFLQVCEAVQYAHRNLIVHRDLKPGNILVTAEGVPKLLDFGIAKLLTSEPGGHTLAALTPEYASPEQVLGRAIGTASDIYSLGVLLFFLLAGRLPYGAAASPGELVRAVCEDNPVWQPAGLIDGDLHSILAQSLRKEPERRYVSVEQFAADLRRYLEGRPVSARSDSLLYRTGKFVRRRAIPLAAAAAVAIAVIAGVASTVAQSRRVERRFNEVRTLAHSTLFDVYDSIKALPGSLSARRLMASNAQHYLDSLARDATGDRALVRDLVESYLRLGDVRGGPYGANLGDTAGALESCRRAQTLIETEAARYPGDFDIQLELAQTYLSLGRVLNRQYRTDEAIAILSRAIQVLHALVARFPDNVRYLGDLARAYQYRSESEAMAADAAHSLEGLKRSLEDAQEAVAIQESPGPQPGEDWQTNLSSRYFSVGYRLMALSELTGDHSYDHKALEVHLKGQAINRALAAAHPGAPSRQLADGLLSTATSRWKCCGDLAGALSELHEAVDHFERLARSDPKNIEARRDLANANWSLGLVLTESGHSREGLAADRKVLAILEELDRADPTNQENTRFIGRVRAAIQALQ